MSKASIISKYRKIKDVAIFSDKEWPCDIFSIFSKLIEEYVANYLPSDPGDSFTHNYYKEQRLSDLLQDDLAELGKWYAPINQIKDTIHFEELYDGFPAASTVVYDNLEDKLILFSSPLLHVIHVFFPYCELLAQPSKTANCLEKYDERALSNEFDDTTLVLKISREMKRRFVDKDLSYVPDINFVHSPFDVCERVRAARRFIIAHELGHILMGHSKQRFSEVASPDETLTFPIFNRNQEYEADAFACDILLTKFRDQAGAIRDDLTELEIYELNNTMIGVRMFFFMLEFVECFREWYKTTPEYPKALIRDHYCATKFLYTLSKAGNVRLVHLQEGFSISKALLLKVFKTAPDMKYGMPAATFIFADSMHKTHEEIIAAHKNDPETAAHIIMNRDYHFFRNKLQIYNAALFDDITKAEFGIWFMYYYSQFGPEAALERARKQLNYKLSGTSSRVELMMEDDFRLEILKLQIKRSAPQEFLDEVNNYHYNDLFENCYNQITAYQKTLRT